MKHRITLLVLMLMTITVGISSSGTAQETSAKLLLAQCRKIFTEGVKAFQDKKYEYALQSFASLVGQYPELQDYVQFFLANTYLNLGENQKALRTFQKFLADYPSHPVADDVRFNTANLLLGEKNYSDAIAIYKSLLDHPERDQGNIYYQLSKAYVGLENYPAAVFALQQVIAFHPDHPSIEDAKQALQTILQKNPKLAPQWTENTLLDNAHALFKAGQDKQALTQYEAFQKQYPQSARIKECEFGIAEVYFHSRNKQEGLNTLEKIATRYKTANPEIAARALYLIGAKHWSADRNAQAQEYMRRIVKEYAQTSQSAAARYVLGRICQDADAYQDAAQWYADVYKTAPQNEFAEEALWRAGWVYYLAQQYAQAEKMFAQVSTAFPNGSFANDTLYWQGRTFEKRQKRPAAIQTYLQLVQNSPYTYYGLLANKRLRLFNIPVAITAKKIGATPELAVILQALQPILPPARYDEIARHVNKVLEFQEIQLTPYALKEIEWLAALPNAAGQTPSPNGTKSRAAPPQNPDRPPLFTYLLCRLYAGLGKYLHTIQLASELEAALTLSTSQAFPYPWETLKYPLAYWELIKKYAQANNLDPFLVAAVIRQESAYEPDVVSSANAKGLMQLMSFTGRLLAQKLGLKKFDASQLFDPEMNIQLGTQYLAQLLEHYDNNLYRTLAAYNAGPDATKKWWPEKAANAPDAQEVIVENITYRATRTYVKQVLRSQHYYRLLYADLL